MKTHTTLSPSGTTAAGEHPGVLEALDRPYFVPWGRKEIGIASAAALVFGAAVLALGAFLSPWWFLLELPVLGLWAFFVLFFRNPRRAAPAGPGLLVAPADGVVRDVETVEEPDWIEGPAHRVGIFLSVFDVHVNRSPADARVEWVRERPGRFLDARNPKAAVENASAAIALTVEEEGSVRGTRILVRQIAGAIARRIVCPLEPGIRLRRGGLLGMIKYGSRTELWIPAASGYRIAVRAGDRVRGGESVLAVFEAKPGDGRSTE